MSAPSSYPQARSRLLRALARRPARRLEPGSLAPAAVLIPVLRRGAQASILFTRRAETVEHHKGQISFPGGRAEPGEDAVATALREAWEEVALPTEAVEIAGCLDDVPSTSSFMVTPVVGLVQEPPAAFRAQPGEVVEPFEVSLSRLLDPAAHRHEWWDVSRLRSGAVRQTLLRRPSSEVDVERGRYRVHFYDSGMPDRIIWGLTGQILRDLLQRCFIPGTA